MHPVLRQSLRAVGRTDLTLRIPTICPELTSKIQLAAYGVSQAHILADFLSSPEKVAPHPIPQLVFSSPFYRCIQTAQPAFTALSESQTARRKLQQEHREVGRVEVGTAANGDVDEVEDVDGKTNPEATEGISPDHGVMLEHGVQEWSVPVPRFLTSSSR